MDDDVSGASKQSCSLPLPLSFSLSLHSNMVGSDERRRWPGSYPTPLRVHRNLVYIYMVLPTQKLPSPCMLH